jgi:hypothetical protein
MDYYNIRKSAYPYNYLLTIPGILLSILGTTLSSLVIFLILKNKRRKLDIDLKLVCFTLIFDILHCFLTFITAVCSIAGFAEYLSSRFSCSLNPVLTIFTAIGSINLVGLVALERYLYIIKQKTLNSKTYYMLILGLQFINLVSGAVSGVFGGFSISSASVYCIYNLDSLAGILGSAELNLSIGASIFMIYFGYINIMIKRRNLALEMEKLFPSKAKKIRSEANSTIIKSTLIIIASTFTSIPYCAVHFISLVNRSFLTPLVSAISILSTLFNMIFNPIIILRLRIDLWCELKALLFANSDNSDRDDDIYNYRANNYQLRIIEEETYQ